MCIQRCGDRGCSKKTGECCSEKCLGGCYDTIDQCIVCRNFTYGHGLNRVCTDICPSNMYKVRG